MTRYALAWRELGVKQGLEVQLAGLSELAVQAFADGLRRSVGISDVHLVEVSENRREL